MAITAPIATQAQIAEPLFCNFHNEAFGITIEVKGKGRRTALRELRTALPRASPPSSPALLSK